MFAQGWLGHSDYSKSLVNSHSPSFKCPPPEHFSCFRTPSWCHSLGKCSLVFLPLSPTWIWLNLISPSLGLPWCIALCLYITMYCEVGSNFYWVPHKCPSLLQLEGARQGSVLYWRSCFWGWQFLCTSSYLLKSPHSPSTTYLTLSEGSRNALGSTAITLDLSGSSISKSLSYRWV